MRDEMLAMKWAFEGITYVHVFIHLHICSSTHLCMYLNA